jgi:DoxX-like family
MAITYVLVTIIAVVANTYASYLDFSGNEQVLATMDKKRVPRSWAFPLGALKAAGVLGLLAGFAVPPLGVAAAIGLVLFFIGAVGAHLRVHYYRLANAGVFLALSVATLTVTLIHRTG